MAVADIREKANEVRQERTSSLKGFFDNCFLPSQPPEDETSGNIEDNKYSGNAIYSENNIRVENATCSENDTLENAICSENDTLENAICSENDIHENATCSENDTLENATCSENDTLENAICSENDTHDSNTVKLAKLLGFTALGVLAVLMDAFPSGSGMLNVTQLSKSCGVARTTLIKQIRILEKCGTVSLGTAEKQGRRIKIMCSENATCSENDTPLCSSSSSSLNIKNYYYYRECSENAIYSDNDTYVENATRSENDMYIENATYSDNAIVTEKLSNSKITIKIAARELYFIAKASSINIDRLSNQCFRHFLSLKQSKGSNYAMALFLSLLSKSRENPTAYVIRAIQQGAAPSQEDLRMAGMISKAGETVFKKVGEEILQRDLDAALSQISLSGVSQNQIQEELDVFSDRISG